MAIGERFQEYLQSIGIQQKEAAGKMGIAKEQLSMMITGKRAFSQKNIEKMIRLYPDLNLNWLLRDDLPDLASQVNEDGSSYIKSHEAVGIITEIEEKLLKLRELVAQK